MYRRAFIGKVNDIYHAHLYNKVFAFKAIDSGSIPSRVKLTALKFIFTASLLDGCH